MTNGRSPFPIRGVIEGFYGTYYTFPERIDMIRFLGEHGFNVYLYGPKNDRQHRMRWWDPYPPRIVDEFGHTIHAAESAGVRFCYAISFGVPVDYGSVEQFEVVTSKLRTFFDLGCRAFAVFLDDMPTYYSHGPNRARFRSAAHAHSDFTNRLHEWLVSLDPTCSLFLCQTEYFGKPPFSSYLRELGTLLDPAVHLMYTGKAICSERITLEDIQAWTDAVGRYPLIWDNYPANDLQMRPELHLGPLEGRDPRLPEVCSGYLSNLMNQAEASKIPLLTIADYVRHPAGYQPWESWERALLQFGGDDGYGPLRRFAENSLASCLQPDDAPKMNELARGVIEGLREDRPVAEIGAVEDLSRYLDVLDESIYYLKNRMDNLALRQNLIPWIEALDEKVWMTRFSLLVLKGLDESTDVRGALRRLRETHADVKRNPKRVGGSVVVELADLAIARARHSSKKTRRDAAEPESAEEVTFDNGPSLDAPGYVAEGA